MKSILTYWMFIIVLLVMMSVPVIGNAENRFDKGSWEIAIGSDSIGLDLEPAIGYFLTDYFEGIFHFDFVHREDDISSGSDSDTDALAISLEFIGQIPTDFEIVPFAGIGFTYFDQKEDVAGTTTGDIDQDAFGITGRIGTRILIGERASINPNFNFFLADISNNISGVSLDRTGYGVGWSFSLFF